MAKLTAVLSGVEDGLKDALDDVAEASQKVSQTLENLEDSLGDVSSSSVAAEESIDEVGDSANSASRGARNLSEGLENVSDEFQGASANAQVISNSIDNLANEINQLSGASRVGASQLEGLGDEAIQSSGEVGALAGSIQGLTAAEGQLAGMSTVTGQAVDSMGDEVEEAGDKMVGTASAAELLSLQSSALSINVGAFTVALRNLTTQIPLLVTTLGNLSAAFAGLASSVGAVGLGGVAVAFAGMAAKAEEIAGPLEGAGDHLSALGEIADEVKVKFIGAIQPLINAEGVVQLFEDAVDGAAESVAVLSESIATAFTTERFTGVEEGATQLQSLETTLRSIGESVQANLTPITNAVEDMIFQLGDDLTQIAEGILSALPEFLRGVTVATEEMLNIFGAAGGNIGRFVSELTNLGRSIAAGFAPIINTFFAIIADIASALNDLDPELVATTAKMFGLLIAANRLAGIIGSLVMPVTKLAGTMGLLASTAGGPLAAFFSTLSKSFGTLTNFSSGIGNLADSFEMMLPPLGESTSILSRLSKRFASSGASAGILSTALSGIGVEATETEYSLNSLADSMGQLFSRLTEVPANPKRELSSGVEVAIPQSDVSRGEQFRKNIVSGFGDAKDRVVSSFKGVGSTIKESVITGVSGVGSGVSRALSPVETKLIGLDRRIQGLFDAGDGGGLFTGLVAKADELEERVDSVLLKEFQFPSVSFPSVSIPSIDEVLTGAIVRTEKLGSTIRDIDTSTIVSGLDRVSMKLAGLPGISRLVGEEFEGISNEAAKIDDKFNISEVIGKERIAAETTDEFADAVDNATQAVGMSDRMTGQFTEAIEELGGQEAIAKMSTEELREELAKMGFTSARAEQAVDELGDELGKDYSMSAQLAAIKTNLFSGALTSLTGIITTLATGLAVLTAGFVALVAVVGTAGAVLQKIGESGKDAEGLINSLRDTLLAIGDAVMPFVVESTELMLDVFNSISAVGREVIGAFQDIAVELGLIEDPASSGADGIQGFIDTLRSLSTSVGQALDRFGKFVRVIAGHLIVTVRQASNAIVEFLDAINAEEILNTIGNAIRQIVDALGGMQRIMSVIGGTASSFFSALKKMSFILGVVAGAAVVATGAFTGLSISISAVLAPLGALISPFVAIVGAIALVTGAIGMVLQRFGLLDAIINGIVATFNIAMGIITSFVNSVLSVVGAVASFLQIGTIIGIVTDAFGMLFNAVSKIVNVGTTVIGVFARIIGKVMQLYTGIVSLLINGAILGLQKVFKAIIKTITNVGKRIVKFAKSFGPVKKAINTVIGAVKGLIDVIKSIPEIANNIFQGVLDLIEGFINTFIKFINGLINTFNKAASKIKQIDKIDKLNKVELGSDENLAESSQQASNAAKEARPDAAEASEGNIEGGFGVGANAAKEASGMGSDPNVNIDEGDTTQIFNQTISANPEDEAQIGRIAKDAMEEANSFKRRQQGNQ